jgi:hypothetical protein
VLASTLFVPRPSRDARSLSRHRHSSARSLSAADSKIMSEVRKKQKVGACRVVLRRVCIHAYMLIFLCRPSSLALAHPSFLPSFLPL